MKTIIISLLFLSLPAAAQNSVTFTWSGNSTVYLICYDINTANKCIPVFGGVNAITEPLELSPTSLEYTIRAVAYTRDSGNVRLRVKLNCVECRLRE